MNCRECQDWCCSWGVDVDGANAEQIMDTIRGNQDYFPFVEPEALFGDGIQDGEFPSGEYRRTTTVAGKCVFSASGRGCILHSFCLAHNRDYHDLKPMVSILFPLTFDKGLLHASTEVSDGSLVCLCSRVTIYRGIREELAYYFGAEFVKELDVIESKEHVDASIHHRQQDLGCQHTT